MTTNVGVFRRRTGRRGIEFYLAWHPDVRSKESAAGDLDVEAGMDEANGRLPNTGGAQAGQGDGDGAAVVSEGSTKSGGMADWDGESESVTTAVRLHPDQPENWSSLSKSQQRHWWRQRKRIHDRGKG